MRGTDTAYGAMGLSVLTQPMVQWGFRYLHSVWCNGAFGTDIAYGAASRDVPSPLHRIRPRVLGWSGSSLPYGPISLLSGPISLGYGCIRIAYASIRVVHGATSQAYYACTDILYGAPLSADTTATVWCDLRY
eukprot:700355-Rhodomonas_salina.2